MASCGGHALGQRRGLQLHADQVGQAAGLARRVHAQDGQAAAVAAADPLQALQGAGLARAVRPQQPEDLAAAHLEADGVHRHEAAVDLAEVPHRDDIVRHLSHPLFA